MRTLFDGREGWFVLSRGVLLLAALRPAYHWAGPWRALPVVFAVWMLVDILLYNTSSVFVTGRERDLLRSIVIAMLSYLQIALVFAIFNGPLQAEFVRPLSPFQGFYFSMITVTTIGYGDLHPCPTAWRAQLLACLEAVIGIYYLVVLVAVIVTRIEKQVNK